MLKSCLLCSVKNGASGRDCSRPRRNPCLFVFNGSISAQVFLNTTFPRALMLPLGKYVCFGPFSGHFVGNSSNLVLAPFFPARGLQNVLIFFQDVS